MKKGFITLAALLFLVGAGCNTAGTKTTQAPVQQQANTTDQPTVPEIKKVDTSNWKSDSFEEITFKYPANFKKLQNGTMPDSQSIVLWTPDNKDFIEIARNTNIKWCTKSICRNENELSPATAQEWFDHGSKSDAQYTITLQNIDGHKTAISVAKDLYVVTTGENSVNARYYNAMILNGNSIYLISLATSDDKNALIADFYSLLDTVHFVK